MGNSAIDGTLLPYAKCEKVLDCDVFTLKEDFEGPECIPCETTDQNFIDGEYIGCTDTNSTTRVTSLTHGLAICDQGQVKDTRGSAKPPTQLALPKKRKMLKRENLQRDQDDQEILGNISKANTDLDNHVMYNNSIFKIMIKEY